MTLILGFISPEYVALASDRRITWMKNGKVVRTEDTENKAILLCGHSLMGYTGLAKLGGISTDRWVLEKLSGVEPHNYFEVLRRELQQAIPAARQPLELSGHAFLAAGYGITRAAPDALVPGGITVSNATGSRYGGWSPRSDVAVTRTPPLASDDDFKLEPAGIVPERSAIERAVELIRRYRRRDKSRVVGVLQVLVRLMREVADSDERVGKDISLAVLPRGAVGQGTVTSHVGGIADPVTETSCMFVPSDREVEQADVYEPAIICPGMAMWGSETWFGRTPPWWRD